MLDVEYEGAAEIERAWREGLTPDPLLSVSEWSDRHRMLSSKASAEPGRWRTSRTPYLKAIMDCLSPMSAVERIVFMKAAQLGATEMGNNWIGYVIHHAPGPMMAVSPTVDMAKYAKRLIQAGVKFIGGCCGTTPAHIKLISDAVRAVSPKQHFQQVVDQAKPIRVEEITPSDIEIVPPEERSNWSRRITNGEFVTTVEVLPPKGCDAAKTLEQIKLLKTAGVNAVNIPDGPRAQTRMSAQATAVLVEREIGIETVLHYCCRDRNLLGMMSDLLGAAGLGLRNLLLITGDPPKMGPYPDATAVFDIDAIGLTNMVNK
ncbi:MAG: phage terminase large subunit family protein, partial [Pseudomonas sp.]